MARSDGHPSTEHRTDVDDAAPAGSAGPAYAGRDRPWPCRPRPRPRRRAGPNAGGSGSCRGTPSPARTCRASSQARARAGLPRGSATRVAPVSCFRAMAEPSGSAADGHRPLGRLPAERHRDGSRSHSMLWRPRSGSLVRRWATLASQARSVAAIVVSMAATTRRPGQSSGRRGGPTGNRRSPRKHRQGGSRRPGR